MSAYPIAWGKRSTIVITINEEDCCAAPLHGSSWLYPCRAMFPRGPTLSNRFACLMVPDFMTDLVIVKTADCTSVASAGVQLVLRGGSYQPGERGGDLQAARFLGDACKAIASRVRGAVAAVSFNKFHKNSVEIIKSVSTVFCN